MQEKMKMIFEKDEWPLTIMIKMYITMAKKTYIEDIWKSFIISNFVEASIHSVATISTTWEWQPCRICERQNKDGKSANDTSQVVIHNHNHNPSVGGLSVRHFLEYQTTTTE